MAKHKEEKHHKDGMHKKEHHKDGMALKAKVAEPKKHHKK